MTLVQDLAKTYERTRLALVKNFNIRSWDRGEFTIGFHLLLVVLFGIPSYALVVWVRRQKLSFGERLILLCGSSVFAVITYWVDSSLLPQTLGARPYPLLFELFILRLWGLGLFPTLNFLIWLWDNTGKRLMSKKDIQSVLEREQHRQHRRKLNDAQKARVLAEYGIGDKPQTLFVGTVIRGDMPDYLGFQHEDGWLGMDIKNLFRHTFVLGSTGAGKTYTLSAIIDQVLKSTNLNVYLVDGKGDLQWAEQMATLGYQYRGQQVPIFKMGHRDDGAVYHGFQGGRQTIYNRLAAMLRVQEAEGGAAHYAAREQAVLQLICGMQYDDLVEEPPRSFREVVKRISYNWLMQTYKGTDEQEEIEGLQKDGTITTVRSKIGNFNRAFGHLVDRSGFNIDKTPVAIFSMQTQSAGVDAKAFVRFFIEDIKDWIGRRKPPNVSGLLIIDEFQTFNPENITDVLSLARSANLGVILATQDLAKLGDARTVQTVLANCNTYFLMKSNFPEEVAGLAGTLQRIEFSYQWSDEEGTGVGSGREQHQFQVEPNEVARLLPGQVFIINSRHVAKVQMKDIGHIYTNPSAIAPNYTVKTVGHRRIEPAKKGGFEM